MSCSRLLAAGVVILASSSLVMAGAGKKVIEPVDGVGIVKVKPECLGEETALEVEVELEGAQPLASCTATVNGQSLPGFTTDDEGEGETKADIPVTDPPIGDPISVTIDITCDGPLGSKTYSVTVEVLFEESCAEEEEEEEEDE